MSSVKARLKVSSGRDLRGIRPLECNGRKNGCTPVESRRDKQRSHTDAIEVWNLGRAGQEKTSMRGEQERSQGQNGQRGGIGDPGHEIRASITQELLIQNGQK